MNGFDVALVRWPDERQRLHALREGGTPRLLVVEAGLPPVGDDPLEDWLRAPVDIGELRIRVDTLRARAQGQNVVPSIDDDGILRFRESMVALPPVQRQLVRALVEHW